LAAVLGALGRGATAGVLPAGSGTACEARGTSRGFGGTSSGPALGADADARSSGTRALSAGGGSRSNHTASNATTTPIAAAITQLTGIVARNAGMGSETEGNESRAPSTLSVIAEVLCRLDGEVRGSNLTDSGVGVQSADEIGLRLAKGSRCVCALRKSKLSSNSSRGTAPSSE
jgi:hypothetical protein